jgi:hypothetical protein
MSDPGSLYPHAKNPLDTLTGFANLQNIQNQNRLFQQQFQTNLGLSEIAKEAVGPDGTIDTTKIPGIVAQHPEASYGIMEAFHQAQALRQQQIANQQAQLEYQQKKLSAIAQYLAPDITSGADSSHIHQGLSELVTKSIITPGEAATTYATVPRVPGTDQIDESKVPQWLSDMHFRVQDQLSQYNAMHPAPTPINQGNQIGLTVLPQRGAPSLAGTMPLGLAPATPTIPKGGGQPGYAGGGFSGQPPGYEEQQRAYAEMGTRLNNRADQVTTNKGLLSNLDSTLEGFTPGPSAKWSKEALAAGNRIASGLNLPTLDASGVKAQEEFEKMAQQLAQSQFQQLGGTGANFQLESTISTSPNSALSKLGNKGIISLLQGNEDAIAAKNRAWQQFKTQTGSQDYGSFSTEFNRHFDPRVFQFQYLSRDDAKKLMSSMSKAQVTKLHEDAQWAKQQGLIGGQ